MLSCRDIAAKASDHLDRKLTFSQSLGYGFHLLLCGYCREFVRHLRTTIELSQHLGEQNQLSDEEAARIAQHTLEQAEDAQGPQ
ncbi:MAG: anti-sigma factor [Pseudomonadales bacterium]|nr:anti-sigma factor [Pseudomonadales bacterium]MCP5356917.1 anti-sigma factor [Pseudomonadales bacterium]